MRPRGVTAAAEAASATAGNGRGPAAPGSAHGPGAQAVCDAIVAAFKRTSGRGPTKVKAYMLGDAVAVVARDMLTTLELTLVRGGRGDLVSEARRALFDEVADECREAIEQATGKRVNGLQTHIDPSADRALAIFRLQPSAVELRV